MSGTLFVVATPIGNLEDISARALRVLRDVRVIAAEDTRRTHHLLARYAIQTPTTSLHEHNEAAKLTSLIARLERGDDIALVSDAGTPTISDPGQRLIRAAIDAAIRVEPIPGPSATMAALAASGIEAGSFLFMGFPPVRSKDRAKWFADVKAAHWPVVLFEAPHRIRATLTELRELLGDRYVSVGREVTKAHEEFIRGPLSVVLSSLEKPVGELTVVLDIGQITEYDTALALGDKDIATLFGQMTIIGGESRRAAISRFARAHGLSPNHVYRALETAVKSVE